MVPVTSPLATVSAGAMQGAGPGWLQAVGALAAVLALLLVSLRLLSRWHRPAGRDEAALVAVWPLGPRREIQLVRLRDEVHYVYRHESGLVVLSRQPWDSYRAATTQAPADSGPLQRLWRAVSGRADSDRHAVETPPVA